MKYVSVNGELIVSIRGTGSSSAPYWIHSDHLGSSEKITDMNGSIVQVLDYYPYLAERQNTGSLDDRKGALGKDYDSETGLNQFGARYMKNSVGRFISQDPVFWELNQNLASPQSLNSYSYANNNPVTFSDPDGRCVDGISTIVCIGAWFALSSIFVGSAAIVAGGITDNPDAIEGGLGMMGVGTAVGGGLTAAVNQPSPQVVTQAPNMKGGPYSVYEGRDSNGDLRYVGITKRDPQTRFDEHGRATGSGREGLNYSVAGDNFSKPGAHIIEQNYLNTYGMQKNGGQLLNKVNSISPSYQIGGGGISNASINSQLQAIINGLWGLIGQMQSAPSAPAANSSQSKSKK